MEILDEKGRLFGVVNVVDALVVLLVLAVVAAGAALVLGSEPEPEPAEEPNIASTHATLDLGTQPDYIVARLNEGDTYSPGGTDNLTITDVRLEPRTNGDTAAVVRVELETELTDDDTLQYDGAPPRLGRTLQVVTDEYQVEGTLTDTGDESAIPTTEREVLTTATVDAETATEIDEGDAFTLRERTIATVESVAVYGTNSPDEKRVHLGLTLEARQTEDAAQFAGTRVTEGASLPFRTDDYGLTAAVERVGTTEPRGDAATRTVTLRIENASPEFADAIQAGMTESANGNTVAEVTDVDRTAATRVLTTEDGDLYERDHPRNVDVVITADLAVRETPSGITFKGRTIQYGSTVTLDLGAVTVRAAVGSL